MASWQIGTLTSWNARSHFGTLDAIDFENINSLCVALGGGRRKGLVSGEREREGRLTSHGSGHAGASLRRSLVILACSVVITLISHAQAPYE